MSNTMLIYILAGFGILMIIFIPTMIFYTIYQRKKLLTGSVIQLLVHRTGTAEFRMLPTDKNFVQATKGKKGQKKMSEDLMGAATDKTPFLQSRECSIPVDWPPTGSPFMKVPGRLIIHVEGHTLPIDPLTVVGDREEKDSYEPLRNPDLVGQVVDENWAKAGTGKLEYIKELEDKLAHMLKPNIVYLMLFVIAIISLVGTVGNFMNGSKLSKIDKAVNGVQQEETTQQANP